jgi:mannose-6-phosphate isomerase-like protein (cupin superfamily)
MDGTVTMKKLLILLVPVVLLFPATGDPEGFAIWTAADLRNGADQLRQRMGEDKTASETLADYGNYRTMLAHREASGGAELHEEMADLFVVQQGDATLVIGGEILNRKTTGPGEVRGTAITGGERHHLALGDAVHIPAGVPHQLLVEPGHTFTYFVVKVKSPRS